LVFLGCLLALQLCLPGSSLASSITETGQSAVTLNPGSELIISFGTWTYAANNPGYSPDPAFLQFEALGPQITTPLVAIPGTSAQYYSGYSMTAYLESPDASVMAPLIDPDAQLLGLPDGTLLFTPGTFTAAGGVQQVAMLSAHVNLGQILAQSLFGAEAVLPWTADARIVIVNTGQAVTFGLGGPYSIQSGFIEPGLSGAGPAVTSGVTLSVVMDTASPEESTQNTPEPDTAGLIMWALAACLATGRHRPASSTKC